MWRRLHAELSDRVDCEVLSPRELGTVDESTRKETVAMITYGFAADMLPSLPALGLVGIPMAGINTLPVAAIKERGIPVVNAHANGRWVAERAMALLLAVTGKIVSGDRDLRAGQWHGFAAGEPPAVGWRSLTEMTVAIVGTGSIGRWAATFLRPFGSRLIGVRRRNGTDGLPDALFDEVTNDLHDAFRRADAVIVTLPSTPETVGLIDGTLLKALDGGFLVNVGRGDVIDERALFRAVSERSIACAIDTWFTYPDPPGSRTMPSRYPLERYDNVVLSPHLGGYLTPATSASAADIANAVAEWYNAGRPASVSGMVDIDAGY